MKHEEDVLLVDDDSAIGNLAYRGNSVAYIWMKMEARGNLISRINELLRPYLDGRTSNEEAIRNILARDAALVAVMESSACPICHMRGKTGCYRDEDDEHVTCGCVYHNHYDAAEALMKEGD